VSAIDFWFEFASSYSYLSAARIGSLSRAAGVSVRWQPFLLGPIFGDQGWNDSPFHIHPAKGRHGAS
jgi:2-hydroxychromene-2-carboxylate isomerase